MKLNLNYRPVSLAEGVTLEVRPLQVWAYQLALPVVIKAMQSAGSEESSNGLAQLSDPLLKDCVQQVLPKHVRNLKGILVETDDGQERVATVEDLVNEGMLFPMAFRALTYLIGISNLSEVEADTLKKP